MPRGTDRIGPAAPAAYADRIDHSGIRCRIDIGIEQGSWDVTRDEKCAVRHWLKGHPGPGMAERTFANVARSAVLMY
jgi:hypothetical protein